MLPWGVGRVVVGGVVVGGVVVGGVVVAGVVVGGVAVDVVLLAIKGKTHQSYQKNQYFTVTLK